MKLFCAILLANILISARSARVSPAIALQLDDDDEFQEAAESSACTPGETYGLDEHGACHVDGKSNGLGASAPEECCISCDPDATYGRDDQGRCRTDINKNGVLDRFALGECCECDAKAVYGRDKDGRCRTDVNKNGLLDRFAKDICCADKVSYYGAGGGKTTFSYSHPKYGSLASAEQCKSRTLGAKKDERMSNRNTEDCIACITEGSTLITHPERCVAHEPTSGSPPEAKEDSKTDSQPEPSPAAAKAKTYLFGNIANVAGCERLTRMNPSMQFRMSEIMYQKQLAAQRQEGKQACIACLSKQKVTGKYAGFCNAT